MSCGGGGSSENGSVPKTIGLGLRACLYVDRLSSPDRTHRAEDRPRYQAHLAEAARMSPAVRQTRSLTELKSMAANAATGRAPSPTRKDVEPRRHSKCSQPVVEHPPAV